MRTVRPTLFFRFRFVCRSRSKCARHMALLATTHPRLLKRRCKIRTHGGNSRYAKIVPDFCAEDGQFGTKVDMARSTKTLRFLDPFACLANPRVDFWSNENFHPTFAQLQNRC